MKTKVCFKCGKDKPLSEFYKAKGMSDGHSNKCKECTKADASRNYYIKSQNEQWLEKERIRGREKYKRLNYKEKYSDNNFRYTNKYKNLHRHLKAIGLDLKGKEIHHWNYNKEGSVFILSRSHHHRVHKYLALDNNLKIFKDIRNGNILDSKEKHLEYMKAVIGEYKEVLIFENVEL